MKRFPRLQAICLGLATLAFAPQLHATPITYNLVLTDASNATYSGTGTVTFSSAPTATYTDYSSLVTALSFTVDGTTFSLTDPNAALSAFEFSQLTPTASIWDITFSDTLGVTPNRLTLDGSGGYTYYYNDGRTPAYGVFGSATPVTSSSTTTTPEPSSLLLLGTGLLAGTATLLRRMKMQLA